MNKEIAEKTALAMQMASCIIDTHLSNLQEVLGKKEFSEYAQKTGKVLGEIYLEVLRPLWDEYPELLPTRMDGGTYIVDDQMYKDTLKVLQKYAPINS